MKPGKIIGIGVIVIVGSLSAWVWWTVSQALLYQSEYGPELNSELGFIHGSPYVYAGGKTVEVFTIYPIKGGFLDKVGFREGDIITSESITGFYKLLYHSRGKSISVRMVNGGDGPPISKREIKSLTFTVPKK